MLDVKAYIKIGEEVLQDILKIDVPQKSDFLKLYQESELKIERGFLWFVHAPFVDSLYSKMIFEHAYNDGVKSENVLKIIERLFDNQDEIIKEYKKRLKENGLLYVKEIFEKEKNALKYNRRDDNEEKTMVMDDMMLNSESSSSIYSLSELMRGGMIPPFIFMSSIERISIETLIDDNKLYENTFQARYDVLKKLSNLDIFHGVIDSAPTVEHYHIEMIAYKKMLQELGEI